MMLGIFHLADIQVGDTTEQEVLGSIFHIGSKKFWVRFIKSGEKFIKIFCFLEIFSLIR